MGPARESRGRDRNCGYILDAVVLCRPVDDQAQRPAAVEVFPIITRAAFIRHQGLADRIRPGFADAVGQDYGFGSPVHISYSNRLGPGITVAYSDLVEQGAGPHTAAEEQTFQVDAAIGLADSAHGIAASHHVLLQFFQVTDAEGDSSVLDCAAESHFIFAIGGIIAGMCIDIRFQIDYDFGQIRNGCPRGTGIFLGFGLGADEHQGTVAVFDGLAGNGIG